jgi:O-antigen/teichoic acid export membrane protein
MLAKNHLKHFLKKHQNKKKYFLNISWLAFEQVLKIIIGLSVGVYVARYLGPTNFGILSYVVAMTGLFNVFCKLGLDSIVVRDLVNFKTKANLYLGTAFWLKFFSGSLCFGLSLGLVFLSGIREVNLYIALIVFSLILQSFEVIDFYFQSKVLSKFISISKIIQMSLSASVKIILIFYQASLVWRSFFRCLSSGTVIE